MASGVAVNECCKTEFQTLKLKHKYRYIIYKLNDNLTEIQVHKKAEPSATYQDFVADLQEAQAQKQCRYAIYDAEYESVKGTGTIKNKLCFFYWSPEESSIKQKMVYSASKDKFQHELGSGLAKVIQANDNGDLEWDYVLEQITRHDRN